MTTDQATDQQRLMPPDGITDHLLWHAAQGVLDRHWLRPRPANESTATDRCAQCARDWPCQPYQLACEAERLAALPRRVFGVPVPDPRTLGTVRPGDLVEIGPDCGPVFTDIDHFRVDEVHTPPTTPDQARLTGRWCPPSLDDRQVTLTVRLDGVRIIDRP